MMKKNSHIRNIKAVSSEVSIIMIAALLMGCGSFNFDGIRHHPLIAQESKVIKRADAAFRREDYNEALKLYESLYKQSPNSDIKRRALYGLACTKLTTAETDAEQEKALSFWKQWIDLSVDGGAEEDPRLLGPYIQRTTPPCQKDAEIKLLMKKNQSMKKEILTLKDQITILKNQISSLEAIDKKIEEKKKEISSP